MSDAIARTLFRLFVTRRQSARMGHAAQATMATARSWPASIGAWLAVLVIAAAAIFVAWLSDREAWPLATPFVALWLASPAIARWASRRRALRESRSRRTPTREHLRLIARRTWRFFETFVTATDHMLPPDNFQEDPRRFRASNFADQYRPVSALGGGARDFGWIGTHEALERLEATLATMANSRAFAAISSIGTTRAICGRSTRDTSPPSTAAISPGT